MNTSSQRKNLFELFATSVSRFAGSTYAFFIAFTLVIIWAIVGPVFHYSENWQLVINTGTTIITFLMVFLIQKSQNKDSLAIQLKLNELVAAHEFASNRMVSVEDMTEEELRTIKKYYSKLNELSVREQKLQQTHSIDEAYKDNEFKKDLEKQISDLINKDKKN
jgi:low affinity Fe/Cu permease